MQDEKMMQESKQFLNELAEFWGFKVENPLSWKIQFVSEFNGNILSCDVSPILLHFNPETVSEHTIFTYINNVTKDVENHKAYIIDYVGKNYVMRMMRIFEVEKNKYVSLLVQKDKNTEETISMQYIEPVLIK